MHIEEVEGIWGAIDEYDDGAHLYAKLVAVRRMGEALRLPLENSAPSGK